MCFRLFINIFFGMDKWYFTKKKLDKYNNVFAILYENRICSRGFSKFTLNKEVFLGYLKGIKYLVYSDKTNKDYSWISPWNAHKRFFNSTPASDNLHLIQNVNFQKILFHNISPIHIFKDQGLTLKIFDLWWINNYKINEKFFIKIINNKIPQKYFHINLL